MSYALVIVIVVAVVNTANSLSYLRAIRRGVRPHALSWAGFCALASVSFATSLAGGGGLAAWLGLLIVALTGTIAVAAFVAGERRFARFDLVALCGALLGALAWPLTSSPAAASVVISVAEVVAFLPAVRKGWRAPDEEQVLQFALIVPIVLLRISAFTHVNAATSLFPAVQLMNNGGYALMLLVRRRVVATAEAASLGGGSLSVPAEQLTVA